MKKPEDNFDVVYAASSAVMEITAHDGYKLKGRLTIPGGEKYISKIVINVNGSGANTYDNPRSIGNNKKANWHGLFAGEFSKRGTAFFAYNTRGIDIGGSPPMYFEMDEEAYQTYLPLNSVEDIYHMIKAIKENERLKDAKVYLLGWSEGTVIAPLVAEKYPDMVDGLFLVGYVNINMKYVVIWQNSGGPSMVWYRAHFETDENGRVSREAYEADPNKVVASVLQNAAFEDIDNDKNGYINEEDFVAIWKDVVGYSLEELLSAIEHRDDEWLRKNYGTINGQSIIPLTSAWFLQHFSLRANMEVLPGLDLPIYIFHGELDQNVDAREVYRVNERFLELGKSNLSINVFSGHDHGLNGDDWLIKNEMSAGIQAIFDTIEGMG